MLLVAEMDRIHVLRKLSVAELPGLWMDIWRGKSNKKKKKLKDSYYMIFVTRLIGTFTQIKNSWRWGLIRLVKESIIQKSKS